MKLPPAPAWSISSTSGHSGAGGRCAWESHEGAKLALTLPPLDGAGSDPLIGVSLLQFSEEGEPTQTFIRITGADGGDVDTDLTAPEVDTLISDTVAWLDSLRLLRAQMEAS